MRCIDWFEYFLRKCCHGYWPERNLHLFNNLITIRLTREMNKFIFLGSMNNKIEASFMKQVKPYKNILKFISSFAANWNSYNLLGNSLSNEIKFLIWYLSDSTYLCTYFRSLYLCLLLKFLSRSKSFSQQKKKYRLHFTVHSNRLPRRFE